jgi:hypothetical protein
MKTTTLTLLFVAASAVSITTAAQESQLSSIVGQFYPTALDADLAAIGRGNTDVRRQCYVVLSADALGNPAIVLAAYTNSQHGVVRVLARTAAAFVVLDETAGPLLVGSSCRAEAVDLDRDGRPEAVVRFVTQGETNDWVYAWRDGALADLSPLTPEGVPIPVHDAQFIDLDDDGILELRGTPTQPDGSAAPAPVMTFRLSAGSYVLGR